MKNLTRQREERVQNARARGVTVNHAGETLADGVGRAHQAVAELVSAFETVRKAQAQHREAGISLEVDFGTVGNAAWHAWTGDGLPAVLR